MLSVVQNNNLCQEQEGISVKYQYSLRTIHFGTVHMQLYLLQNIR